MSILATIDTLDDRREAFYCLTLLPPIERVAFLLWMCDQIPPVGTTLTGENVLVTVTNNSGEAMEAFLDMFAIASQYGLPVQAALAELERRAKVFTSGKPTATIL